MQTNDNDNDKLTAMEEGFNIARSTKYKSFFEYVRMVKQQEAKPKEWEIVACKSDWLGEKDIIFKLIQDDLYIPANSGFFTQSYSLQTLLDNKAEIYSVKRLRDGEVFTVGDEYNLAMDRDSEGVIVGFIINRWGLNVDTNKSYGAVFISGINKIQKVKPILFTTEQVIEIIKKALNES